MQLTKPSHFSIFTSIYPRDHGVVNNELPLTGDFPLISEAYQKAGYETAGFCSVRLLGRKSGTDRGFDHFDGPETSIELAADVIVPRVTGWLESRDGSRPFFLWTHLFDPHTPYAPPKEYTPASTPEVERMLPSTDWNTLSKLAEAHDGILPRAAYDRELALYGGEVEYADHWLGVLFDSLRASGELDRTIVVLTADHGECFENGFYFDHSGCLFDGAAMVPLIFRYPKSVPAGARRPEIVENLDIAPTLLRLSGVPVPAEFLGRDLFDAASPVREAAFLQHPLYNTREAKSRTAKLGQLRGVEGLPPVKPLITDEEQAGLRTREWKYIVTGEKDTRKEQLFAVPSPETDDVAATHPDVLEHFRPMLEKWRTEHPIRIQESEDMNEELLQTLRGLGYVQ